jgi:DNA polymerase III subunit delta
LTVLLFHGDNALEMGEATRVMRERFNAADVLVFDGPTVSTADLSEACLTAGLFDPERLVIVHDLHERLKVARKDTSGTVEVVQVIQDVAPTTTLLLLSPDAATDDPLLRAVRDIGGEVRAFITPRKPALPRWIVTRARYSGATIDPAAAELLADLIGGNTVMLESELGKLSAYAGVEKITPAMVDSLVGQVTQESIFALVDAIAAGDKGRAFKLLHTQLNSASSAPMDFALYLIRMLARQMRILLGVRLGLQAGKSQSQLISDLRLPRYYADRYFRQARRIPQEQLVDSFERLAALDQALKTGKADAGTGLDMLVAELCV